MSKHSHTALPVAVGLSFVLMTSGAALAADNWLGTWKANPAKSTYSPGPAPKSTVARMEAWEGGLKGVTDGIGADDKATHTEYAAKFDGKDYPYKGNPALDAISLKRVDDNTYEVSLKSKGKVMLTVRNVISKDGKTRTQTSAGTDAQGRTVNNVVVFDRQ